MSRETQTCPICGAKNSRSARTCAICNSRLSGRSEMVPRTAKIRDESYYDPAMGEDDLLTASAPGGRWLAAALILLGLVAAAGMLFVVNRLVERDTQTDIRPTASASEAAVEPLFVMTTPTAPPTNTRIPPPPLPTITPTVTITPTPGPCEFTVADGDTLYDLALRCGHRDFSIVDIIVRDNFLQCAACLKIGDVIEVPRPTPIPNQDTGSTGDDGDVDLVSDESAAAPAPDAEINADDIVATRVAAALPTLDPNLMYHTVEQGQTMYEILAIYDIDVKLLSEINPEMEFAQCDFGIQFGGENCAVMFSIGQQVRVPAPTPTPTIPPTASGSETPTPTATPTVNVPEAYTPREGAQFDASSIVTLRWVTTGTLGIDEVYVVRLTNNATQETFIGLSCQQALDVPMEWQPDKKDSTPYTWNVSIGRVSIGVPPDETEMVIRRRTMDLCTFSFDVPIVWGQYEQSEDVGLLDTIVINDEKYPTEPRRFFWQGRG